MTNYINWIWQNFNPRSREGSDPQTGGAWDVLNISIHAPAKGATIFPLRHKNTQIFQSTLPRRERPTTWQPRQTSYNFNPRSREGSDGGNAADSQGREHFNPRSREGSDAQIASEAFDGMMISIHAPAKGATRQQIKGQKDMRNFNPRSREGSDVTVGAKEPQKQEISIHAPAKGATRALCLKTAMRLTFQSTLPRRERL